MDFTDIKFYFIEGNIGAGKETIIKWLKENITNDKYNYYFYLEGVDKYTEKITENETYLSYHYKDKKEYFIHFQYVVLLTFKEIFDDVLKKINITTVRKKVFIFERSPMSMYYIFFNQIGQEYYNFYSYSVYTKMFKQFFSWIDNINKQSIYISVEPIECMKRIIERNRQGEKLISIQFLEDLHNYHLNYCKKNDINIIDNNTNNIEETCIKILNIITSDF